MSGDDEVYELDAELDLANQKIRQLRARIKALVDERKAARTPGTATLDTPVGEIEGRSVLIGGVQGRTRQPGVARLLAAARVAMGFIPDRRDHAATKAELRAAIAEHEAAQPARSADIDAL